jgi:hypothetical protein
MAIEAPVSKYKKTNCKIYIIVCILLAIWFGYDGYFNKNFIQKHTDEQGSPTWDLDFNRRSPPFFAGAAILLVLYYFTIKNKKLLAGENELIFNNKKRIAYDSIEKIDKTYFDSKGHFTIMYSKNDKEHKCKLSKWNYDNLKEVLDFLVAKISQTL